MFEKNIELIMAQIQPNDIVLDIGGWAQPFRRANYVIDAFPYDTRGWYATIGYPAYTGPETEHFTKDTWIQRDICTPEPFPFQDKSIDYAICSHVLEDIRDPLRVCGEIIRVAKRGYIEVPSRLSESIYSKELQSVGAPHHRWLVSINDGKITFEMKYHLINKKGLHLPAYVNCALKPEDNVSWLFWDGSFGYEEAPIALGLDDIKQRLRGFVQANMPAVPVSKRLLWQSNRILSEAKACLPRPLHSALKAWYQKVMN